MAQPTTTIRVSTETRDRLMTTRGADFAGQTLDQVIQRLLDQHAAAELRVQLQRDAEHARTNAADLAEVARVNQELEDLSAW